ncbi:hypothetical protein R3P38DRAFT_2498651 [Favolaschia claudopus]|uniref:DUF6589 domain-containing protein n=1 Tax=Favolaschia claudopus TaxID=2862362 RepID=A0AAW0DXC2_9AGAR
MDIDSDFLPSDDILDTTYMEAPPSPSSNQRRSNDTKAAEILSALREMPNFSFRTFLVTVFTSKDPSIKNSAGVFFRDGGPVELMELWFSKDGLRNLGSEINQWIMAKSGEIGAKEFRQVTDRAGRGPHTEIAQSLRVRAQDSSVRLVQDFRLRDLTAKYDTVMPNVQQFFKALIGKENETRAAGSRNPDDGRTLMTSIALNLRSRRSNLHQVMNGFIFWDNRMPKRLVQMMNRLGVCASYQFRTDAVVHMSRDSVKLARAVAADSTKLKMLPYDNFNWVSHVFESSAAHRKVTHDQVSALLVVVNVPDDPQTLPAHELASVKRFEDTAGARHRLPAQQSLEEILPSREDQKSFRINCIKHVEYILCEEVNSWASFRSSIEHIVDPRAIPPHVTEMYYLPTYDQEQGSTRGNMLVLHHYFIDVLRLPKNVFEHIMFFVLGDRLTTARDRAAQDQRALDRSEYRADHLSSIAVTSGLMHECLNFIENVGKNYWGDSEDSIGLAALRSVLPNREEINLRKFDFYAWLRFLDVILRSLIMRASMVALNIPSVAVLAKHKILNFTAFQELCTTIADTFLLPSVDRLEADGIKKLRGNTVSGNAVLLTHDLMTLREMRHAIKHGHPSRVRCMLKYWAPMFYAGGSYNYAHETMELLHNIIHDWPTQTAEILEAGMIFNTQGGTDTFLEGDLGVEHFNDVIKEHVKGSNATPGLLEKIVPALGHIQHLTVQMYKDVGVEDVNQHHAKVRQHKDVELLIRYFTSSNLFDFTRDKISEQTVVDLYRHGLRRLAGNTGGHAKHLARHKLRFRTRHMEADANMLALYHGDRELEEGRDSEQAIFTVDEEDYGYDLGTIVGGQAPDDSSDEE